MARRVAGQIISAGEQVWIVRIYLGRHSQTGKRVYQNRTIHGPRKKAQSYLHKKIVERDAARETDGSKLTLNQYLDRWLETTKSRVRERTFEDYATLMQKYVRVLLGEKRLTNVTPLDIQNVCKQMLDRKLSARTVHYMYSVLGSAMRQAVKWELIDKNPAAGVQLPRKQKPELKVLDLEQSRLFLKTVLPTYYGTLFAVAVTTGMRPSEYLALKWSDVDFGRGTVSVSRTLSKSWRGWAFNETKRIRSRRVIKLQSWIVRLLGHLKVARSGLAAQFTEWPDGSDLVFTTTKGAPVSQGYLVTKHFKPLLKLAGLPNIRLYDLRHTAATLGLCAGVPPKVVSEQLGHANAAFTLDVYSHVMPHMQEEAAAKVEAVLLAGGSLVTIAEPAGTPERFKIPELEVLQNEQLEASCPQHATPPEISAGHTPRTQEHNSQPST